jgi:hypothetical protein
LTTDQIAALETADLVALTTANVQTLSTTQIAALGTDQVAALGTAQVVSLRTAQAIALSTDQIVALSTASLAALSTANLRSLSTAQVAALTTDQIVALTTAQAAGLSTANVGALTTDQIVALETADLVALTTANVQALSTEQVVSLTTAQVVALGTAQIASLSTASVQALTTSQVDALTTAQVESLNASQFSALTTSQIEVMDFSTPIVLDLDGDGVRTLALSAGVQFDVLATGSAVNTGWVSQGDGLLVMDHNGDGVINDGSELFGSSTTLANGDKAADGYVALAELDSNHDGVISSADATFADLRVWVDANTDGISSTMELKTLDELGITQLGLATDSNRVLDKGNLVGLTSTYQTADGASHAAADVWFAVQTAASSDANLGARVSDMAQAIGAFAATPADGPASSAGALTAWAAQDNTPPLAISSLVDALRQFDAHGKPVDAATLAGPFGQPVGGLDSKLVAQLANVDLRPKTDIASPTHFAPIAMPK